MNKATMINLSIEAMEVMARECLEPKVSKAKERANNKRRKEKGLQYTRSDGIVIPARKIRPACSCRRRCFNKYPDHVRSKLLRNFLNLKLSGQNQFLANHMEVSKTARRKVIIYNTYGHWSSITTYTFLCIGDQLATALF